MLKARASGTDPGMPAGTLMAAFVYAGRDTAAQVYPVLALRLRSGAGGRIAGLVKDSMQQWDDER